MKTFTEPKAFTEPLKELQGYEELEQALKKTTGVIQVSGCIDAIKPHIAYSVKQILLFRLPPVYKRKPRHAISYY